MLNWANGRERFRPYIADYRLNLIEPYRIRPEDFPGFRTRLRQILEYIKYSDDKSKLIAIVNQDPAFQNLDRRTVHAINVLTGSRLKYDENEEAINVCKAIDDMIQDAVQEKENELIKMKETIKLKDTELQAKNTELQARDTALNQLQEQLRKVMSYANLTEEQIRGLTDV